MGPASASGAPAALVAGVGEVLGGMGLRFTAGRRDIGTGFVVDYIVEDGGPRGCALLVNGPDNYIDSVADAVVRRETGATALRQRLLAAEGYRTGTVRFWEWDTLADGPPTGREQYLRKLIRLT